MEKKNNSNNRIKKWVISLTVLTAILTIVFVCFVISSSLNRKKKTNMGSSFQINSSLVEPETVEDSNGILFLMLGVDDRDPAVDPYTPGKYYGEHRSDSMMIVSIDPETNIIKLISVLRDSKVPIKGYEPQKLNAAYKYGGVQLALDTFNTNFHLDLHDYIVVDFRKMRNLIDLVGGVELEITAAEAELINSMTPQSEPILEGWVHLDGFQALSYSRIRAIDGDEVRVIRQQRVLQAVLQKINEMGLDAATRLLPSFLENMETSFCYDDLYNCFTQMDPIVTTIEGYVIPNYDVNPELWGGWDEAQNWYWLYDLDEAAIAINDILK